MRLIDADRAMEIVRDQGIEMVYCPNMIGGWGENEWFCADGKRKGRC